MIAIGTENCPNKNNMNLERAGFFSYLTQLIVFSPLLFHIVKNVEQTINSSYGFTGVRKEVNSIKKVRRAVMCKRQVHLNNFAY
jgi:hypothetical protein